MSECVAYLYVHHKHTATLEASRGCWVLWNWSYTVSIPQPCHGILNLHPKEMKQALEQWFSVFLILRPFNTIPHVGDSPSTI